ncbi:MAG: hypothetical protein ABI333_08965 [bacterium]
MRRILPLCLLLVCALPSDAQAQPAGRSVFGSLDLKAWDARKDVYVTKVTVWRAGCKIGYQAKYWRAKTNPIKLRLHIKLDAGPAATAMPWVATSQGGPQSAEGELDTPGCWIKAAKRLVQVSFDVLGDPPRAVPKDGREFLGKVTFNRWGSSGDVYYRHIQTWRKGCQIHYQFLYKRHTAQRRRLKLRLEFDNGTAKTGWYRSEKPGWREIVGSVETTGCFASKARTLRTSGFESERY